MSRFEQFKQTSSNLGADNYRQTISGNGGFDYNQQVSSLIELSNKFNTNLLIYLFDEKLGRHLVEKFAIECKRNLLDFLNKIDVEMKFFILHELKTNKTLFAHC